VLSSRNDLLVFPREVHDSHVFEIFKLAADRISMVRPNIDVLDRSSNETPAFSAGPLERYSVHHHHVDGPHDQV